MSDSKKSDFIQTQITLLQQMADGQDGADEAAWARFFELYHPAMLHFAQGLGNPETAEDVVQDVLIKLVSILREGKYERREGQSFRAYLKTLIRNQLKDRFRRERTRGYGRKVELNEEVAESLEAADPKIGSQLDAEWARACQSAAVEHVLTKTALSEQSKQIYLAYAVKERPLEEVAAQFGVSKNLVSQIKTRVDKMVTAVAREFGL